MYESNECTDFFKYENKIHEWKNQSRTLKAHRFSKEIIKKHSDKEEDFSRNEIEN